MKAPIRPGKRRISIVKYIRCLIVKDNRINEYYGSRALVDLVRHSVTTEGRQLRAALSKVTCDATELSNLTYDFLKTSPVYNNDTHCMEFLEDNIIPYLEVDNTVAGNYYM